MEDPLWIDFVNSDSHDPLGRDADRDHLEDAGWIRDFLEKKGLPRIDARTRRNQSALRDLRDLLLRITSGVVDKGRLRAGDLETINRYLAARPVTSRLEMADDACHVRLTPVAKGLDAVLFAIVESFASFLRL